MQALRHRTHGLVGLRLSIDVTGHVSGCIVASSSGSRLLDDTACALLSRRSTFVPAADVAGSPVPDVYETIVTWQTPTTITIPGLRPAFIAWVDCLNLRGPKHLGAQGSDREILDAMYGECLDAENKVVALLQSIRPVPLAPVAASIDARRSVAAAMLEFVHRARTAMPR